VVDATMTASVDRCRSVDRRGTVPAGVGIVLPRRRLDRTSDASVASARADEGSVPSHTRAPPPEYGCGASTPGSRQDRLRDLVVKRGRFLGPRRLPHAGTLRMLPSPSTARGTRPTHLSMSRPPDGAYDATVESRPGPWPLAASTLVSGRLFTRSTAPDEPEKRTELGHRSLAPATFFGCVSRAYLRPDAAYEFLQSHDLRADPSSRRSSRDESLSSLPCASRTPPPRGAVRARRASRHPQANPHLRFPPLARA